MNAPIKYFGGKGTMYNRILEQFPVDKDYKVYVEPFSGTYTVGLHMDFIPPIEIYNDLERNVYTLYKVIRDREMFSELQFLLAYTPYSEDMRYDARERLKDPSISDVERAYNFFILNRMSHNGIGGFSVNCLVRRGMSKSVSDYLSSIDRLPELHERLQHLVIYNRDGLELIEKFSQKDCFLYCDPPYAWTTRGETRYIVDNDMDWHDRFIDLCIRSEARILISGYDCEEYHRLEENGFRKVLFDVSTIDGNLRPKTKTEALWKNYDNT